MQTLCGRPLTFGDAEQIKIINQQQKTAEKELEIEKAREAGTLKRFKVHYTIMEPMDETETVEAFDVAHAEEVFLDLYKGEEVEINSVKEI